MKTAFVFLFLLIGVLSLDDQAYLTGFCNQLGFTQAQITANINCFSNANTDIQNFKDAVTANGASISDSQILNFIQAVKYVLVDSCSSFQDNLVDYFSANTNAPVFQDALCNNMDTYNSQIKQKLVTWAATSQDSNAGQQHAYIYQVLFGVLSPVPTASFTTSVNHRVVTFDAAASTAPEGSITNYAWNFGESSSGSNTASGASSTATHTYTSTGGTFTVTLTITDSDGDTATKTGSVTIAANSAPTASFTQTISSKTITFDAGTSTDSDGSIATYAWDFGESSSGSNTASGSTSTASHTYASYGTYTIVLTVTDNEGATATYSNSVRLNSPPTASFTNSVSSYTVSFNAAASTDSDGTISTYAWNFGESSSSSNTASGSTTTASHTYAAYGTYAVVLTVTDNDGATGTQTANVVIGTPGVTVSFTTSTSYSGNQVTFTSSSTATIVTYSWDFGDSSSSSNTASVANPVHAYSTGTYTVSLTVTDNTGATGTASKTITITSPCGNLLHFILGWNFNGDCDTVVRTPNGKVIAYWNTGPDSGTDQGQLLNDSTNGASPEELCWATGQTPPSGTYNICININFPPSPSVTAQLNVIKGGVSSSYTKTFTSATYTEDCFSTDGAFITSITYP